VGLVLQATKNDFAFAQFSNMKYFIALVVLGSPVRSLHAQNVSKSIDLGISGAAFQGSFSAAYLHQWRVGKNKKIELGVGGRFTAYLGANQYYVTAPAKLTSGKTGPGVIFLDNVAANIDTFLIASPMTFSVNAMVSIGYRFTERFTASFNIDAIGFSFGSSRRGNYINGAFGQNINASPTAFNLLLVSDNDLGSLNSELVGKYKLTDKLWLRGGAQFLFTEYTTESKVQQFPEPNDRFRNKSLMLLIGVSIKI